MTAPSSKAGIFNRGKRNPTSAPRNFKSPHSPDACRPLAMSDPSSEPKLRDVGFIENPPAMADGILGNRPNVEERMEFRLLGKADPRQVEDRVHSQTRHLSPTHRLEPLPFSKCSPDTTSASPPHDGGAWSGDIKARAGEILGSNHPLIGRRARLIHGIGFTSLVGQIKNGWLQSEQRRRHPLSCSSRALRISASSGNPSRPASRSVIW